MITSDPSIEFDLSSLLSRLEGDALRSIEVEKRAGGAGAGVWLISMTAHETLHLVKAVREFHGSGQVLAPAGTETATMAARDFEAQLLGSRQKK